MPGVIWVEEVELIRVMRKNSRVVFGELLLVGFCCFLLFGVSTTTRAAILPTERVGDSMSKKGRTRRHEGLVLNYVSKRSVPNGPDPIHNRKIGNEKQPPERA